MGILQLVAQVQAPYDVDSFLNQLTL